MLITEERYLAHYGILRKSGRYPWGSGETQSERNRTFLSTVEDLRKQGLSETDIARGFGITTSQLRASKSIARAEEKQAQISFAERLKAKGYSNVAIGEKMHLPESSVRALLAPGQKDRAHVLSSVSDMLKAEVADKKYIDIGTGVEKHLPVPGLSPTKLKAAVSKLQGEGYTVHYLQVEQLGTGQKTTLKVLAAPGVTYSEVYRNRADVKLVGKYTEDGGRTLLGIKPPVSISSKRVKVRYAEEGGTDADGVIYVRPGVKDISLGGSRYAQVRIAVDGTHYLKGMAMYKDDLPDGVDLMFNTNKKDTGNKLDAMKPLKEDKDNPFGAVISRQTGVMNIVNEEGNWEKWSNNISSQVLSKQAPSLARDQLNMTYERKQQELAAIRSLSNPAVRKKMLEAYAEDVDASAVHLKAAALPRQGTHVILPINSMKENEIYAPNFRPGERVALIRYPHGGTFEIPELTVNNRHPEAKKLLGDARDAVGIHSKVAERLSGADFDGDTVLVIPNGSGKIRSTPALEGLRNFDSKKYKLPDDSPIPRMTAERTQLEMGLVSNLITDMTIRGATTSELARAVRHSMVVIDAAKHGLNYKQSAIDNGIANLKQKYQDGARAGASTLISRARSDIRVNERKQSFNVDPVTGKKIHKETGAVYVDSRGETVLRKTKVKRLAEAEDAHTLSSGTTIERVYADHSNRLKALANTARREAVNTKGTPYSPSARATHSKEVASLDSKLALALRNAPLERQAQVLANAVFSQKKAANPDLTPPEIKRLKGQALAEARIRTGAKKDRIVISEAEWAAIQAGAVSTSKLNQILTHADLDQVKKLATPTQATLMTSAKTQRAKSMLAAGYVQSEIADALGVSLSTLKTTLYD